MSSGKQIVILFITIIINGFRKKINNYRYIYILRKYFLKLPNVKGISLLIVNYIFIFYKEKRRENLVMIKVQMLVYEQAMKRQCQKNQRSIQVEYETNLGLFYKNLFNKKGPFPKTN